MATIEHDLNSFNSYARQQIATGQRSLSIDELFEQWRLEKQYAENVSAIQASIQDFKNGDRGAIAGDDSAQMRREFGVVGE